MTLHWAGGEDDAEPPVAPSWRWWAGFILIGSAAALAYRGDWTAAGAAGALVLMPVLWRVRAELIATRDVMCGMPVAGKHRRRGRPRELRPIRRERVGSPALPSGPPELFPEQSPYGCNSARVARQWRLRRQVIS